MGLISDAPVSLVRNGKHASSALLVLGDEQLEVELHHFTPEEAAELLTTSTNYRSTTKKTVAKYARDMSQSAWWLNGETIITNVLGELVNGFHRLEAAVESGCGFTSLWVKGVNARAVETMDSGRPRSIADVLRADDVPHASTIQTTLNWEWRYRQGVLSSQAQLPSREEQLSLYRSDPQGFVDAAALATRYRRSLPGPTSNVAGIYHIALEVAETSADVDPADVTEFFERTRAGVNLSADDPSHLLREWLSTKYQHTSSTPSSLHTAAVTVKALNLWMTGETVKQLKYSRGGRNKENFPMIGLGWA